MDDYSKGKAHSLTEASGPTSHGAQARDRVATARDLKVARGNSDLGC